MFLSHPNNFTAGLKLGVPSVSFKRGTKCRSIIDQCEINISRFIFGTVDKHCFKRSASTTKRFASNYVRLPNDL